MRQLLAPAHLALTLIIIIWDVVLAGRIAQLRQSTKPFAAVTGLCGLLLIPAFIVALATTTLITGRAISAVDWVWPLVIVLFAAQSVYAIARRLVSPIWGYPIAFYNVLIAVAALTKFFSAHGLVPARPFLILMAAQIDALALGTTEAAISAPFYLHVPLIAPAFPGLRRLTGGFRAVALALALVWFGLILAEAPRADVALTSYDAHNADRLTERPDGFLVGMKILPDVASAPSAGSVSVDLELADSLNVDAILVQFAPGATVLAIDSVAHSIEKLVADSTLVIASIGYRGNLVPELGRVPMNEAVRLTTLRRILTRLKPDIVLPAEDPYGSGARILGRLPVETWQAYYTHATAVVREVRPRTRVAFAASKFDSRDSTLYAWAAAPGSPIDVLGFAFYPDRLGARTVDASLRAADRWMQAIPPRKPHWVFGAGGFPLAHGERSQDRTIWAALAWATGHREVRGLVVKESSDYGQAMGLRAPNGRFRLAASTLRRSIRALHETSTQTSTPQTR